MKVLVMDMKDDAGVGLNISLRAQEVGHEVVYWTADDTLVGEGMVARPKNWEAEIESADLTILTGNCDYPKGLEERFAKGYPIFGTNPKAAELELDRGVGQEVLKAHGIQCVPYKVVASVKEGIELVVKSGTGFAMKPWGGEADKAMTCICKTPEDAIFTLLKWQKEKLFKGQLMMQELVEGAEIGVSCFFGPNGWCRTVEESFEHKKLMNDELGPNTGEMGTVIRHVGQSKLFDMVLEPLTDYLHLCRYVGDCSVNCIVGEDGTPWPLEFTMRLGWPDFNIRQEVIRGDPVQWMLDLLRGKDTMRVTTETAIGVVMAHGDFPQERDDPKVWSGYPIRGISSENYSHLHFQQAMDGSSPLLINGKVREVPMTLTAGTYPLVVTGRGMSVREAQANAYSVAWSVKWPSNVMFRTDIGNRLREDLPYLQQFGFAEGMVF